MSENEIKHVKELNYSLYFVSPELHSPNIKSQIEFSKNLKQNAKFFLIEILMLLH